jgi:hypothetical protein
MSIPKFKEEEEVRLKPDASDSDLKTLQLSPAEIELVRRTIGLIEYLERSYKTNIFWYHVFFSDSTSPSGGGVLLWVPEHLLQHKVNLTSETDVVFRDILRDV